MKTLFIAITALTLSGCSTIYFHKNSTRNSETGMQTQWHHTGILGLVEFSDPVDLGYKCQNSSWNTVRTQNSFVTGLVEALVGLYNPREVGYTCLKMASTMPAQPQKYKKK